MPEEWKNLPEHNHLIIYHNLHKAYYKTIEEYLKEIMSENEISYDDYNRCLQTNEIWEIQIYPRTPISFDYFIASTFEELIDKVNKHVE